MAKKRMQHYHLWVVTIHCSRDTDARDYDGRWVTERLVVRARTHSVVMPHIEAALPAIRSAAKKKGLMCDCLEQVLSYTYVDLIHARPDGSFAFGESYFFKKKTPRRFD